MCSVEPLPRSIKRRGGIQVNEVPSTYWSLLNNGFSSSGYHICTERPFLFGISGFNGCPTRSI